ncbi:MAG TPA: hypothetical protein VGI82_03140 [Chitinophagaceae bacterium]|jgi:23S rRNA A2030 N6-methylase RlmJ
MTAKIDEKSALRAIKKLRKKKLNQGLPFMINSDTLDTTQCYLEYPDGSIKIVEADTRERDFQIVLELSMDDANKLRKKLKLL